MSVNRVEEALKSVDIELRNSVGEFRSFDEVILELSKKWDTLSINQQKYIATSAAGSRQQSRFIALVSDYDRTLELIDIAEQSAGASTLQFNTQLTGLNASINRLKSSWEGFYTSFSAGPSLFSSVVDITADLVSTMADFGATSTLLVGLLTVLPIKILAVAGAQSAKNAADAVSKVLTEENAKANLTLAGSVEIASTAIKEQTAATLTNIKAQAASKIAVLGAIAPYLLLGAAVAGLAAGFIYLATQEERQIKNLKEQAAEAKNEAAQYQQNAIALQNYTKQLEEAKEQHEDYSSIVDALIQQFPDYANEILAVADDYDLLIEKVKELHKLESQKTADSAIESLAADAKSQIINSNREDISREKITQYDYTDPITGLKHRYSEDELAGMTEAEQAEIRREAKVITSIVWEVDGVRYGSREAAEVAIAENIQFDEQNVQAIVNAYADSGDTEGIKAGLSVYVKANVETLDSLDQEGQAQFLNAELEKQREYLEQLTEEYFNLGYAEEQAAEKADILLQAYNTGNAEALTKEDIDLLASNFGGDKDQINSLIANYEQGVAQLKKDLAEIGRENFSAENIFNNLEETFGSQGTAVGRAFSTNLFNAIEEAGDKLREGEDLRIAQGLEQYYKDIAETFKDVDLIGGLDFEQILSTVDFSDAERVQEVFVMLASSIDEAAEKGEPQLQALQTALETFTAAATASGIELQNDASNFDAYIDTYKSLNEAVSQGVDREAFSQLQATAQALGVSLDYAIDAEGNYVLTKQSAVTVIEAKRQALIGELEAQLASINSQIAQKDAEIQALEATAESGVQVSKTAQAWSLYGKILAWVKGDTAGVAEAESLRAEAAMMEGETVAEATERLKQERDVLALSATELEKEIDLLKKGTPAFEEYGKSASSASKKEDDFTKMIDRNIDTLEEQIEQLEDAKDALQDQIDALEKEKEALEEQKAALEETSDALENYIDLLLSAIQDRLEEELQKAADEVENYYDAIERALDELIDEANDKLDELKENADELKEIADEQAEELKKQSDYVQDFYDSQIEAIQNKIDAMNEENDALERSLNLQKAQDAYERAKSSKTRLVLTAGGGWRFKSDKTEVQSAAEDLRNAQNDSEVAELERQIDALEAIKELWQEIADNIGKTSEELEEEKAYSEWLSSLTDEELKKLLEEFKNNVSDNNDAYQDAQDAQDEYDKQSDESIEGSLGWQIDQWEQAKEQAQADREAYEAKLDENKQAVIDLANQLKGQLGSGDTGSIQDVLDQANKIANDSVEKQKVIQETLDKLEYLNEIKGMTTEELMEWESIQNLVNQSTLDQLLEGGSTFGQLENSINELRINNDKIAALDNKIKTIDGVIDELKAQQDDISKKIDTAKDAQKRLEDIKQEYQKGVVNITTGLSLVRKAVESIHIPSFPDLSPWASFSSGGVANFTGPAMLHGSRNAPEIVLNNEQASSLFDFIDNLNNTPKPFGNSSMSVSNPKTVSEDYSTSFKDCVFEIRENNESLEKLIKDIKRKVPFKNK